MLEENLQVLPLALISSQRSDGLVDGSVVTFYRLSAVPILLEPLRRRETVRNLDLASSRKRYLAIRSSFIRSKTLQNVWLSLAMSL